MRLQVMTYFYLPISSMADRQIDILFEMFPLFSSSNISIDDAIKPAQVSIKVVTTDQWPKLFMGKAVIGNYINV